MHMDQMTRDEIKFLMTGQQSPCVSIYMPTHPAISENSQDRTRFKNLVRKAESMLEKGSERRAKDIMKPAWDLFEDREFWFRQNDGLAVFVSRDIFKTYRLPLTFDELVVVTGRFHIKPLLPLLRGDGQFHILALSQNKVRLFHATRHKVTEVEPVGVPGSLDQALAYDEQEKQLQFHTSSRGPGGAQAMQFHGQGVGTDDSKDRILRFFRLVDKGLNVLLSDKSAPLVAAGVDYLLPIYREASTYPNLLAEGVTGNPDRLSAEQLHEQAWRLVEPHFERAQEETLARFRRMSGTGLASGNTAEIVRASHQGRIENLFVPAGVRVWGEYDPDKDEVKMGGDGGPGEQDLLDLAAAETFMTGGRVFVLPPDRIPGDSQAAALFRY